MEDNNNQSYQYKYIFQYFFFRFFLKFSSFLDSNFRHYSAFYFIMIIVTIFCIPYNKYGNYDTKANVIISIKNDFLSILCDEFSLNYLINYSSKKILEILKKYVN